MGNIFTIVQGFISQSSTYTSIMTESRTRGNCCHYTLYIVCCVVLMMIKSLPIILTFNSRLDQIHEIANGISPSVQIHLRSPRALISQLIVRPSI